MTNMTEEEQERIAIQETIDESGCQIIQVPGDNYIPDFSYTIGLYQQYNHPEVICFGLSLEVMQTLLCNVKDRIEDGQIVSINIPQQGYLEKNINVHFLEVDKAFYKDYLSYAVWFYNNDDFPAIQLVWPDKKGNFPWQSKFDKNVEFIQPLLDRDTDFKFYESKELGVFVTTQILAGKTIKYVIHDEEGDWFFLESENDENDDIQIVALEEIIKLDPTINNIYHLQYGWEANRKSIDEEWNEMESPKEEQD